MLRFPRALSNKTKKKTLIIYQLHSILNYIQSIKTNKGRKAYQDLALCYIMKEKSANRDTFTVKGTGLSATTALF
jgi:hypothetical protein